MTLITVSPDTYINIDTMTFFSIPGSAIHFISFRTKNLTPDELSSFASKLVNLQKNLPHIFILPTCAVNLLWIEFMIHNTTDQTLEIYFINKTFLTIDSDNYKPFLDLLAHRNKPKRSILWTPGSHK